MTNLILEYIIKLYYVGFYCVDDRVDMNHKYEVNEAIDDVVNYVHTLFKPGAAR